LMESLTERCPTTRNPPSLIYRSPQYTIPPPTYQVPLG
jgi:hypothetical protein